MAVAAGFVLMSVSLFPTTFPTTALASPSPSPTPGGTSSSGGNAIERQPTQDEVKDAQERAARLNAEADARAANVAEAEQVLRTAAARAGLALERYRTAVLQAQDAQRSALTAQERLAAAETALERSRALLGRWAHDAYANGLSLGEHPVAATLLTGDSTTDLELTVVALRHVGQEWTTTLREVEAAQHTRRLAADRAQAAADTAVQAAADAGTARSAADAAVRAQRTALETLQTKLAGSADAAKEADEKAALLAKARARALADRRSGANEVTGPVGDCLGGDVTAYANGKIPLSVLCPLWGASGEYLRADAAYAFNRLSQAYATEFGSPLCVTDSYRPYVEQVQVYARSPALAAVPGTSNHGWGTAADLCGGIERFGTRTHEWMLINAPLFGWFHPAWAEPSGSMPEPWHWEYGG